MTLMRACSGCGGEWPAAWFPWWGERCRACRAFGPYFARVFNAAYWRHAHDLVNSSGRAVSGQGEGA